MKKIVSIAIISLTILLFSNQGCKEGERPNIFTVQDDMELGLQVNQEIEGNPQEYPLMDPAQYPEAYQHIQRIRDSILNTGLVDYGDKFAWEVSLLRDDEVLNAFATPGGYLYFYTGLIKFLDNEAQFAGVMGHEMAHAAERHSTENLTKVYGLQVLLSVVLGQDPGMIAQIAADLAAGLTVLAFSRNHEYEADEFAVKYLYNTSYDARGVAGFFEKLEGSPQPPQFLSTHPSHENRISEIMAMWEALGGKEGKYYVESYNQFKSTLP
ncbi:MAG: M48 family metalloprotease [Bacteroidales bacterium]|nr:M48 family metalloprotease [Bacteroidales bacterium]MCF8386656.1 M48 family metalloprotease [Bacteroidales bacterium]MCF8399296.1 M48 family metalloprotease [Bacteroidales bacterium]